MLCSTGPFQHEASTERCNFARQDDEMTGKRQLIAIVNVIKLSLLEKYLDA